MFVWQRDEGCCAGWVTDPKGNRVQCGSKENLEYDHIIPVSKEGSNTERNIQLLCERCNRTKGSSILTLNLAEMSEDFVAAVGFLGRVAPHGRPRLSPGGEFIPSDTACRSRSPSRRHIYDALICFACEPGSS